MKLQVMSEYEVYSSYRRATNKKKQARILAEINDVTVPVILKVAEDYGKYLVSRDKEYSKVLDKHKQMSPNVLLGSSRIKNRRM